MSRRSLMERFKEIWRRARPSRRLRAVVGTSFAIALLANLYVPLGAAAAATTSSSSSSSSSDTTSLQNLSKLGAQENLLGQTVNLQLSQMNNELASIQTVSNSVYGSVQNGQSTVTGSVYSTPPPFNNLPKAPSTFIPYIHSLINGLNGVASELPIPNEKAFAASNLKIDQVVSNMSQKQINLMYWAMSQARNWQSFPDLLANVKAQLARTPNLKSADQAYLSQMMTTGGGSSGPSTLAPDQSTGVITFNTHFNPTKAPTPSDNGITCPPTLPYPGMTITLNTLTILIDGLTLARDLMPPGETVGEITLGEGLVVTFPDPGYDVVEIIQAAAAIVKDGFQFSADLTGNCNGSAHQELLVQLYNNLANTQSTVILQNNELIQMVDALTKITRSRTAIIITNIGILSKNVKQDIGTVLNGEEALGQVLNAQELQQIQSQKAARAARKRQLTIAIERDLSASLGENVGSFELPSSAGGYLNSAPVGVQSVVTKLAVSMHNAKQTLGVDVTRLLSLADAAVAAQRYKDAYALFKIAYHEMTDFGPLPSSFSGSDPGRLHP